MRPTTSNQPNTTNYRHQHIYTVIADQIDAYERRHGPLADRSCFDGDIVVPPHLRNAAATLGNRHSRLNLLVGGLSRSRTFLTLPAQGGRQSLLHGSVPDLSSRSVPATPNVGNSAAGNGRRAPIANGDSVESVQEEEDVLAGENGAGHAAAARIVLKNGVELRRKSDHDVAVIARSASSASRVSAAQRPQYTTPAHYRNQSESVQPKPMAPPPPRRTSSNAVSNSSSFAGIPFRLNTRRPASNANNNNGATTAVARNETFQQKQQLAAASSLHNIHATIADPFGQAAANGGAMASASKWGNVRNSNSFSNDFNVGTLSTKYTIPRPHLVQLELNGAAGGEQRPPLSDQQIILKALGGDDSAA